MSLDRVFKALSDPQRRRILELLREAPLNAGAIAGHFELSAPTISHHLAQLREAGLVEAVREGTTITYHLNMSVLDDVLALIAGWKQGG